MSSWVFLHRLRTSVNVGSALFSVITGLLLVTASVDEASSAYYHDLEKNRQPCSDCHILHYPTAGGPPAGVDPGGPFKQLLIRATTNKLCFFCHDGSDPKAPDVLAAVTMYGGSGDEHSGGGFFDNTGGFVNPTGHDLGLNITNPKPDGSTFFSSLNNITLTCASCHDPHGTINYRNVLTSPAGGTGVTVEMGNDVFRDVPPTDPVNAYKESNLGYKAQTSKWCVECHDTLKPLVGGASRGGINHHLTNFPIDGLVGGVLKTVPTHWTQGYTGGDPDDLGFGLATELDSAGTEGVPRLRFQVPGASDFATSQGSEANKATSNQVICTTCHLAHGGKYKKGLVWPHVENTIPPSADADSGCAQCHKDGP
jgi:hypothetical protein